MKILYNKYIALPGLYRLPIKKYKLIPDIVFILIFTGLPSSFYAFFDRALLDRFKFLDLYVIFLVVSIGYFILFLKHLPKLFKIPGGKALFALGLYLCFQLLISVFIHGIDLVEVLTVFRKNFFWPISAIGFLLYIVSLDIYRIERIFRIIFVLTIALSILFLISNVFNFDFYALKRTKENLVSNNIVYTQNLLARPSYLLVVFVFAIITSFSTKRYNKHWQWLLGLLVTIILVLRASLIVFSLSVAVGIIIILIVMKKISITNNLKVFLLLLIMGLFFAMILPTRAQFLIEKFQSSAQDQYYYRSAIENIFSTGSFGFRIKLITDAFLRSKSSLLLGNGYLREAEYGSYDFVLGLDTGIAPVIYCEGLLGMLFRWIPIIILLTISISRLFNRAEMKYHLFYIAAVTLIIPQFVNIIQTKIFVHYHIIFFVMMMLQILIYRDKIRTKNIEVTEK